MEKPLRPAEDIVADLLKLKAELWEKHQHQNGVEAQIAMKINSCLYSGYDPNR